MACACIVCRAARPAFFVEVGGRRYFRCAACEATFLDPAQRLGIAAERAHYATHRNDPEDGAYRRFLSRLANPLLAATAPGAEGLDFGCGPGPALAAMLDEAGRRMTLYDPAYAPDPTALARSYDFIACAETAEHFFDPAGEFDRLGALLRPGGVLGVMTCFQTDDARFAGWRYRMDPTHVVFYRAATLRAVAAARGWTCEVPVKDVALMRV